MSCKTNQSIESDMDHRNWFEKLTGMREEDWDIRMDSLPKDVIKNAGEFKILSLMELYDMTNKSGMRKTSPKLKIYVRNSFDNEQYFETSAIQMRSGKKCMYQVASNFNCLEIASKHTDQFSGRHITELMTDSTQGPSASSGAPCGAMLRLAINREKPINLLEDTTLKPENGKLRCGDFEDFNSDFIKVGLNTDTRAMFDRSGAELIYNKKGPLIDQVYTSTCICATLKPQKLTQKLLDAAYEATYLCAVHRRSKRLVLTLVGGGVFGNHPKQIAEAITKAHKMHGNILDKECVVELPLYSKYDKAVIKYLDTDYELIKFD